MFLLPFDFYDRMDELYLNPFHFWDKYQFRNFSIHADEDCYFHIQNDGIHKYLSPHHYLFHTIDTKVNTLSPLSTKITPKNKSSRRVFLPALQIKDLSIDVNSVFLPVVDINASNVVINLFADKEVIPITPKVHVPLTIVRIGGWTLDEFFSMIPPPPAEEGLYPRLGILNLTDVRILSHTVQDGALSVDEIIVPDAFFYPLFQLTSLAGKNGTDQMFISSVILKSIIMVLRNHTIKDDGIVSKSIQTFLVNIQKSSEVMEQISSSMHAKMNEWVDLIDDELEKAGEAFHHFMITIEKNWNEAVSNESSPLYNLSKEAKYILEGIDHNLSKVGHTISHTMERVESDLNIMTEKGNELKKEIQDGFYLIKTSLKDTEDYLNTKTTKIISELEVSINEASKELEGNIKKANRFLHNLAEILNHRNEL
jgi:hypothetical protein